MPATLSIASFYTFGSLGPSSLHFKKKCMLSFPHSLLHSEITVYLALTLLSGSWRGEEGAGRNGGVDGNTGGDIGGTAWGGGGEVAGRGGVASCNMTMQV